MTVVLATSPKDTDDTYFVHMFVHTVHARYLRYSLVASTRTDNVGVRVCRIVESNAPPINAIPISRRHLLEAFTSLKPC